MILKIEGGGGGGVPCNQVVNSRHPTKTPAAKFIFRRPDNLGRWSAVNPRESARGKKASVRAAVYSSRRVCPDEQS